MKLVAKKNEPIMTEACSVRRTVNIIGDGWSFMILRECYFGVRRFQDFQEILGIPRGTLTVRLNTLVTENILKKETSDQNKKRLVYRLTKQGLDLYKVMIALMSYGDKWIEDSPKKPLKLTHKTCNHESHPFVGCPHCRQEIYASDVTYKHGPGFGLEPAFTGPKLRKSTDPLLIEKRRPSSVARAHRTIGDHWGFMVLREAFFKVRRFDQIQNKLGIAPNTLTNRLNHFLKEGIFHKVQYQANPDRFEYRLTDKGRAIFSSFMAMLSWGDKWLAKDGVPLILTHQKCGHDFTPLVMCDFCKNEIHAKDMLYETKYVDPKESLKNVDFGGLANIYLPK
jgi:DNA-binding HxlR family transcriptional regulator